MQAYVFEEDKGGCVSFLVNIDSRSNATVEFRNKTVDLLPKSISILQGCNNVIFNTATVSYYVFFILNIKAHKNNEKVREVCFPVYLVQVNVAENTRTTTVSWKFDSEDKWQEFGDVILNFSDTSLMSNMLLEQMNTTKDVSDYLWYTLE